MKCENCYVIVTRVVLGSLLLAAGAAVVAQERARIDTSPRAVLATATTQLKAYQEALQFVLADERAVQEVFNEAGRRVARRETTGDFFLAYVSADGGWLAVRDISAVDGAAVERRDELRALLTRGSMARIGRAVADRNARYNIGSITRNFNNPMLALFILDPAHQGRFRFERRTVTATPDGMRVVLEFTERDRPTLIQGADGSPVFTRGELTIDPATGQMLRSVITMKDGPTSASLSTTFTRVEKLNLWLPSLFVERYEHETSRLKEVVTVESTYTNYRKFEATARIK